MRLLHVFLSLPRSASGDNRAAISRAERKDLASDLRDKHKYRNPITQIKEYPSPAGAQIRKSSYVKLKVLSQHATL